MWRRAGLDGAELIVSAGVGGVGRLGALAGDQQGGQGQTASGGSRLQTGAASSIVLLRVRGGRCPRGWPYPMPTPDGPLILRAKYLWNVGSRVGDKGAQPRTTAHHGARGERSTRRDTV